MSTDTIPHPATRRAAAGPVVRLAALLCVAPALLPARAPAQVLPQPSTATAGTAAAPLQEVIVTGSRIPVPANITATSPITVVDSQQIKLQGRTDLSDLLNTLPQATIGSGNDFGNTSNPLTATGGFTTVDLRGLGPQRTLVLVNGRRLGVGDPSTTNTDPAADLDQIPLPLVERVDVVTGGASATYGSDAIAGVVNFVLRHDFQGFEVDGQYGFDQHDNRDRYMQSLVATNDPSDGWEGITPPAGSVIDGHKQDLSIVMGTNFADGAGNVTGYFVFHNQAPITAGTRDFSDCETVTNSAIGTAPTPTALECFGSSNSNRFTPTAPAPGAPTEYTVLGNQLLPWPQSGSSPPAIFNPNSYEYLQRQDKRYTAGFLAHDDLNDHLKPYVEFNYMDDKTEAVVAPAALFVGSNPDTSDANYLINCSNPLLSAEEQSILCTPAQIAADTAVPGSASADVVIGRRNVEGGGRESRFEHQNFRIVGGVKGEINDAWSYDAYTSYYYVSAFTSNTNYLSYTNIDNALQVTRNAAGSPVCIHGGSCVPYDIFAGGAVTPAMEAYLEEPGTAQGNNTEQMTQADLTGGLDRYGLISPWARDGVAVNLGADYRKDTVTFAPDAAELSGDLAGFGGASVPTDVAQHVSEGFFEFRAPLVQRRAGFYDLTVDSGYRQSHYDTAGTTNTYKFEVQYAPVRDARVRLSLDRAVRAPNLIELYNAPSIGEENSIGTDPCAPTLSKGVIVPATATLAQCEQSGVTAAEYGNGGTTNTITQCVAGQCSEVIEGNARLKPEVATTWSMGITLTPTAVPNLMASIDYYHINLQGEINAVPITVLLSGCIAGDNPFDCSQIVRSTTGSLQGATVAGGGYFLQKSINTGAVLVSGIDLDVNYRMQLPGQLGHLNMVLNGSYLQHDESTPYQGSATYDCAGLFGVTCNNTSVNPKWRHNLQLGWQLPWPVLLWVQWRYIGPTAFDNNSAQPLLQFAEEGAYDPVNARIPGYNYFDVAVTWNVLHDLQLRGGIDNVLDKDPPILPEADITGFSGSANTFNNYDTLGRQIFVAFTARF